MVTYIYSVFCERPNKMHPERPISANNNRRCYQECPHFISFNNKTQVRRCKLVKIDETSGGF